jgi:hypothetical protein
MMAQLLSLATASKSFTRAKQLEINQLTVMEASLLH